MNKNLFEELKDIGFKDIEQIHIFEEKEIDKPEDKPSIDLNELLYDRSVICPVCGAEFKTPTVKSSSYKSKGRHSDFYIDYTLVNPYFYDVWLCNKCGYAALKSDFNKVSQSERNTILTKISSQWSGREYNRVRNVNEAIERYKLALYNYICRSSKNSTKAITCLKIAWMYRLVSNEAAEALEKNFLQEALNGFLEAYYNEPFPIYNMDKYAVMYLIGEIHHRLDNYDDALIWFSNVITTPNIKASVKELARDQKDSVKIKIKKIELDKELQENDIEVEAFSKNTVQKKQGFFSKLFKK